MPLLCPHPTCPLVFKSQHGRTYHIRTIHTAHVRRSYRAHQPEAHGGPHHGDGADSRQCGGEATSAGNGDVQFRRARRSRITTRTSDLPVPRGRQSSQKWRKHFVPSLLSWAGSCEDPFGTNGQMNEAVTRIWRRVYPGTTLVEQEKEIVLRVCENTLNNWRSDLGKAGYRVLVNFWETDPTMSNSAEARAEYVADSLSDLRFVYKEPDACFTRGAFCSPLISKVFARHLRKVSTEDEDYSPQIGALALATAAVERALTLFKTGEDALKVDRESNGARAGTRSVRGLGFVQNPLGEKAREFVKSAKRINDSLWDTIIEYAYVHLDVTDLDRLDENNSEDGSRVNPRAVIDLD